jgi:hypothetical protein
MQNKDRRFRLLIYTAVALVAVWAVAFAVFHFSARTKVTAEKVGQFVAATDLSRLSATDRDRAVAKLAGQVNSLTPEERMKWRRDDSWKKWFSEMTENERRKFVDATLPTGLKQMMDAFSRLPPDQRKNMIDDAVNKLKQAGAGGVEKSIGDYGRNGPPVISPELEQRVREIGLSELFAHSSAETKAELAPLLEQMQTQIRQGRRP